MSRSKGALGFLLPLLFAVVSCGSNAYTKGSFCSEVGHAGCDRAVECQLETSVSACAAEVQDACCGYNNSCGQKAQAQYEDVLKGIAHDCAAALDNWDCESLYYYEFPPECQGILGAVTPVARQSVLPPSSDPAVKKMDARTLGRIAGERLSKQMDPAELAE